MSETSWQLDTGGDYDCETCGWTNNGIEVSQDDLGFYVIYRLGCYGGGSVSGATRERAVAFILECEPVAGASLAADVLAGRGGTNDPEQ